MHVAIPDLEERILMERDGLLVFNKPHDIPSTGLALDDADCVQHALMQRCGGMVWAVHQLDADTTGLNLFVTDKRLVDVYMRRLVDPASSKTYLALVHGMPSWKHREEFGPIGMVDAHSLGVHRDGKPAHSAFDVVATHGAYTLVKVRIFTGRTHQIRVHLAHLGHPLVGEEWYRQPPCLEHPRQALHAWRMELAGEAPLRLYAPLAPDLCALGERLGLPMAALSGT